MIYKCATIILLFCVLFTFIYSAPQDRYVREKRSPQNNNWVKLQYQNNGADSSQLPNRDHITEKASTDGPTYISDDNNIWRTHDNNESALTHGSFNLQEQQQIFSWNRSTFPNPPHQGELNNKNIRPPLPQKPFDRPDSSPFERYLYDPSPPRHHNNPFPYNDDSAPPPTHNNWTPPTSEYSTPPRPPSQDSEPSPLPALYADSRSPPQGNKSPPPPPQPPPTPPPQPPPPPPSPYHDYGPPPPPPPPPPHEHWPPPPPHGHWPPPPHEHWPPPPPHEYWPPPPYYYRRPRPYFRNYNRSPYSRGWNFHFSRNQYQKQSPQFQNSSSFSESYVEGPDEQRLPTRNWETWAPPSNREPHQYQGPSQNQEPPPHDRGPPPGPPHDRPPPPRDSGPPHERGPPPHERGPPPRGPPPHDWEPPHERGPPPHDWGPPHERGPPPHDWGPPHERGPPPNDWGPPHHRYPPPPRGRGSPPRGWGPPPRGWGPPPRGWGPPPRAWGPPPRDEGPPPRGWGQPPDKDRPDHREPTNNNEKQDSAASRSENSDIKSIIEAIFKNNYNATQSQEIHNNDDRGIPLIGNDDRSSNLQEKNYPAHLFQAVPVTPES